MKKTLLAAALAASVFGGGASSASATIEPAPGPWEAPKAAAVVSLAARTPNEITGPSTFAMGIATLAGAGLLHWRRRRYLALTAAL